MAAKKVKATPAAAAPTKQAKAKAAAALRRTPLPQSGWVALRSMKAGHGHVHGGEIYPDTPSPAMIALGWVEKGTGTQPADPLAGVTDDAEAERIRAALSPERTAAGHVPPGPSA